MNNYPILKRGEKKPPNKFNFKCFTENTVNSLHEVEYFLNNFTYYYKYIRLYKILR